MRVLITSVGIRGYLVRYFRKAIKDKGVVFAADCSQYAPALYDADNYFLIPDVTDKSYLSEVLRICEENEIDGVISLNDLELPILAEHKGEFAERGIEVIVSDPRVIDVCYDKYRTFLFLEENGFSTPQTYVSLEPALVAIEGRNLRFPILVKPRRGSASRDIKDVYSVEELSREFLGRTDVMIQECVLGDEYGVDAFNNADLVPVAIYAKKKIRMRAGETERAISVYDGKMIELIRAIAQRLGFYGPADIDLFKRGNDYIILEINPRFGGGYPLSHALGADFPDKVIALVARRDVKPRHCKYRDNVVMMKQYEVKIRKPVAR